MGWGHDPLRPPKQASPSIHPQTGLTQHKEGSPLRPLRRRHPLASRRPEALPKRNGAASLRPSDRGGPTKLKKTSEGRSALARRPRHFRGFAIAACTTLHYGTRGREEELIHPIAACGTRNQPSSRHQNRDPEPRSLSAACSRGHPWTGDIQVSKSAVCGPGSGGSGRGSCTR